MKEPTHIEAQVMRTKPHLSVSRRHDRLCLHLGQLALLLTPEAGYRLADQLVDHLEAMGT